VKNFITTILYGLCLLSLFGILGSVLMVIWVSAILGLKVFGTCIVTAIIFGSLGYVIDEY
jgi:hypothetical protein